MTKIAWAGCLAMISCLLLPADGEAKTRQEYLKDVDHLMSRGRYDSAFDLAQEGRRQYPGDIDLISAQAEIQYFNADYIGAADGYLTVIDVMDRSGERGPRQARYHENLIRAYIRVGYQSYFSEEICLRIVYHQERIFELQPETAQDERSLHTLYGIMDYYEMARAGAKLIKGGGSGDDVILPDDRIPESEKQYYLNKARERLGRDYDA